MLFAALLLAACTLSGALCIEALGARFRIRRLGGEPIGHRSHWPRVSIVVPAHNEEAHLEPTVRSLMAQDYPNLEIVLVDDRSQDRTGAMMDELARQDPRIRTLHVRDLPPGWMGKNHAMWVGARAATGEWLLFTDADVYMHPDTVRRAVDHALRHGLDHLTVAPLLTVRGLALAAWVGLFTLLFIASERPHRVRDPRCRHGVGVGAFNLIRRAVYEAIGTHRAIALRPDDDRQLGRQVKRHGYVQDMLVGGERIRVAWYHTLREAFRGLEKNTLASMNYRWDIALVGLAAVALAMLLPWIALILGAGWIRWTAAAAIIAIAAGYLLANPPPLWRGLLVLPVGSVVLVYALARALVVTALRGGVHWGGRFFPLEQLRQNTTQNASL
ncbi:glycosyltransferase family 2 protein [Thermaerobacter sp. PB12/4term]|uniref:glycosyltransferase n=1 Tax=Thermaerobacter sp. PB12/4term TaxID=2293838 RepID=UPI001FAC93BB|nr:glycosyltransferase family 2 protein [Thermaerobacter sp. PB12/4term]